MTRCGSSGCGAISAVAFGTFQPREFAHDPVRPERSQQVELRARDVAARRSVRLTISPWPRPVDRGVRIVDEARQSFRQPMIAARLPALAVHALLDHDPVAVVGDDEAVQVEIEAVLHGGAVDLGDEPARLRQRRRRSRPDRRSRSARAGSAANACRARRRRGCRARLCSGVSPRLSAPMTLVVMPEECQSIPITAPKDWNQNGCARRRSSSSRP